MSKPRIEDTKVYSVKTDGLARPWEDEFIPYDEKFDEKLYKALKVGRLRDLIGRARACEGKE